MEFARVESQLAACADHLDRTGERGSEIEAFLTRYMLVVIYAAFEEKVKELIALRGRRPEDPHLTAFTRTAAERLCRSIKVSELAGLLGVFGVDYKEDFKRRVPDEATIAYSNILANRHGVAHEGTVYVTFEELGRFYADSIPVLEAVERALRLTAT